MVERVDYVLEERGALLSDFTTWQRCDRLEYRLICPSIIARQHLNGVSGCHITLKSRNNTVATISGNDLNRHSAHE
jgi:hypothetical protein